MNQRPPRYVVSCFALFVLGIAAMPGECEAQRPGFNFDESKVPEYTLPDPLATQEGESVTSADQWRSDRRPELLELFRAHVYGRLPAGAADLPVEVKLVEQSADGPHNTRRIQFEVAPQKDGTDVCRIGVLAYLPKSADPVPVFLGLNFKGNHSIHSDPAIVLNQNWQRPGEGVVDHRATEATRGIAASRWAVEKITGRGYGLLTAYYGDIDPDVDDFSNGPHPAFYSGGQTQPAEDEWGSIAAWAWGLSRVLDALEQHPDLGRRINAQRIAVMGHSRLGKTSLWAGASDPRFAMVISNDSGCGGAALSRRAFGETVERINTSFPHWFADNFNRYNDNEAALPVDQHQLIALIAPRPVYVASAVDDQWADPRGEYLSLVGAAPVYELLLGEEQTQPLPEAAEVDDPIVAGRMGYHIRSGKHDVTDFDWEQYLNFADRHLKAE
jgi:hypothetical protein